MHLVKLAPPMNPPGGVWSEPSRWSSPDLQVVVSSVLSHEVRDTAEDQDPLGTHRDRRADPGPPGPPGVC